MPYLSKFHTFCFLRGTLLSISETSKSLHRTAVIIKKRKQPTGNCNDAR